MNQQQREYLDFMEKSFKAKSAGARDLLRTSHAVGDYTKLDTFANSMDICAELVAQIHSDLEKFEKGGDNSNE